MVIPDLFLRTKKDCHQIALLPEKRQFEQTFYQKAALVNKENAKTQPNKAEHKTRGRARRAW